MLQLQVSIISAFIFAAMVTAPLHKGIINDAGISFTGHTEYLAQLVGHSVLSRNTVSVLIGWILAAMHWKQSIEHHSVDIEWHLLHTMGRTNALRANVNRHKFSFY